MQMIEVRQDLQAQFQAVRFQFMLNSATVWPRTYFISGKVICRDDEGEGTLCKVGIGTTAELDESKSMMIRVGSNALQ